MQEVLVMSVPLKSWSSISVGFTIESRHACSLRRNPSGMQSGNVETGLWIMYFLSKPSHVHGVISCSSPSHMYSYGHDSKVVSTHACSPALRTLNNSMSSARQVAWASAKVCWSLLNKYMSFVEPLVTVTVGHCAKINKKSYNDVTFIMTSRVVSGTHRSFERQQVKCTTKLVKSLFFERVSTKQHQITNNTEYGISERNL